MAGKSQFSLLTERRFLPFFLTQFFGAGNDNVFKFAFTVLATYSAAEWGGLDPKSAGAVIGGVFILPFVLFSATAGQLADKVDKAALMRFIKNLEIAIMLAISAGFVGKIVVLLFVGVFLMGLHSTLFGPVKYAYLPQHLHETELTGVNMHDASLSEEGYLRVIRSKTAKLFEASARLAALLSGSSPLIEQSCADYGQSLGTAFQVIDDVLDYDGDALEMGKNLGDDLREGKATLPLIIAMQRGTEAERSTVRQAIESGGTGQLDSIIAIVQKTGALQATRQAAAAEARRALDALLNLPQNSYSNVLQELASQLLDRRS